MNVTSADERAYLTELDGRGLHADYTKPDSLLTSLEGRASRSEAEGSRNSNEGKRKTHADDMKGGRVCVCGCVGRRVRM